MEFTEDMLRRIANNIADLRTTMTAMRLILVQLGGNPQQLDELIKGVRESPHYQIICDELLEQLKGGH